MVQDWMVRDHRDQMVQDELWQMMKIVEKQLL